MSKIFLISFLLIILLAPLGFVLAISEASDCQQYCSDPYIDGSGSYYEPAGVTCICSPISVTTTEALIENITNWIYWTAIAVAPILILFGAFMFLTAAGDPNRVTKGKKIMLWTFIGLLIIMFAKGISSIIKSILGV